MLGFIRDGGYALKAYDRFKRLTQDADGTVARQPSAASSTQHRLNAGIIVEATMLNVRFKNGRTLGKVEEGVRRDAVARRHLLLRRASSSRSSGSTPRI